MNLRNGCRTTPPRRDRRPYPARPDVPADLERPRATTNGSIMNLNLNPTRAAAPNQFSNHGEHIYPVEVRDAGHMGNGVFATRTIRPDETACFYDGLIINPDPHITTCLAASIVANSWGHNIDIGNVAIAGFTEELRQGGVGQLCNDATTSADPEIRKSLKEEGTYNVEALLEADVNCFMMKATRKIRKGEELFFDYGAKYWHSPRRELIPNRTVREHLEIILGLEQFFGNDDPEIISRLMERYTEGPTDPTDPLRHYRNRYQLVEEVRDIIRQHAQDP